MIEYLKSELILELSVNIGSPHVIGHTDKGYLRVIPITGGYFKGERIRGKVLPGGADWNTRIGSELKEKAKASHVYAKYTLQTDDGVLISVENEGMRGPANEPTHIVTTPRFQVEEGKYSWLNYGVFVGALKSRPDKLGVDIKIYKLK